MLQARDKGGGEEGTSAIRTIGRNVIRAFNGRKAKQADKKSTGGETAHTRQQQTHTYKHKFINVTERCRRAVHTLSRRAYFT